MKRSFPAIVLALCLGPAAVAAAPPTPAAFAPEAEALLARNYPAEGPGAAVLVARGDTVLFRGARGEADIATHAPLRPDSVFRIASITKQFTAAGLLTLVEAGKVSLDDPLSKYLPDYPGGEAITLLQLLNHTAGLRNYSGLIGQAEDANTRDRSTAGIIALFRDQEPEFAPGARWAYSNSGYALIGAVIEAVTGRPWHLYLEETLFRPLGMRNTGYGHRTPLAARQVQGYAYRDGAVAPMQPMSMTLPHAAGSLVSTADDLLTWNRALHEGRVLKSETYRRMVTPVGKAEAAGYGFGLYADTVRSSPALWHGGHIFGFTAVLLYLPGPDITVVVLENDDSANSPDTARNLARKLAARAVGDPYPEPQAVQADAATLQPAEGLYRFDGGVIRILKLVDGRLTAQRNGAPRAPLTPIGPGEFLYPDGFNRLKLEYDAAGRVAGLRHFPNGDGPGVVGTRVEGAALTPPAGILLPRAALDRLTGAYASGGLAMKVYVDAGALKAQLGGQPPVDLRAVSPTRFEVDETGASLDFPPGDGPAAELTVRQGAREVVLRRSPAD